MKEFFKKYLVGIVSALVIAGLSAAAVFGEDTYTATTMRLLHYEGSVEIKEASGESGVLMENLRFNSGATLHTGEESSASIGMDSSKIVTLDQNTTVEFTKKNKKMKVRLSEGNLLLDVKEKLKDDETLDIETSNMAVGIRGTAVVFRRYSLPEYLEFLKGLAAQESGEGQNAGQNSSTQVDPQANGLSDINQMIEDLEKEMEELPDGGVNAYVTVLGILEGSTTAAYTDSDGQEHSFGLESGKKITLIDTDNDGHTDKDPIVNNITAADLTDHQKETIDNDSQLKERIKNAGIVLSETSGNADNQNIFDTPIIVTAQSASKMFDGTELTYTSDVVVEGVPAGYTYKASATGSQTDAGQGDNPVDFHIYDTANNNADVTGKFTNVTIIPGVLTVDPAPLHAWSGSASKVYDGTPLTSNETKLTFSAGYEKRTQAARNLSYVVTEQPASSSSNQNTTVHNIQTLYGISGTILVHGSNPITGETLDIPLAVGERLTVYLYEKTETTESTIEYKIDKIGVEDIPNQILRLYRDNPDLVNQACIDAGWDLEALQERIKKLPAETEDPQTKDGINYPTGTDPENMMQDSTNVRINIDTDLADYRNRALDSEEAHFRPMKVDSQIKIVTKASITDVGSIPNEFEISWGNAKETNYILTTEFGTLTVTEAPLTVKTGSAEKEYDGEPLTNSEASISGLVHGETASVTATGSITKAGSTSNSYSLTWGSAKSSNYSVSDSLGTLKVTANDTPATITISVSGKTYDGTPLNIDTEVTREASSNTVTAQSASGSNGNIKAQSASGSDGSVKAQSASSPSYTITGLPDGFGLKAKISGTRTDAGSSKLTVDSYTILDTDGNDVTDCFSNIVVEGGDLTIKKAEATVTTGSATKEYDGTALTDSEASISGLVADETATVTATGSVTDVASKDNTYTIDWGDTNKDNYSITDNLGTLKVTKNKTAITFTAKDASKTYDGKPLTEKGVTASGIPENCTSTAAASGSQTDVGSSANTVSSYSILDGGGNDVTSNFTNISTADGTLTVKAAKATVTTGSATKEYDGTALTDSEASITGLVTGETATVTATGSVTNVESKDNTYTIDWGDTNKDNYTLTENLGTLEVTKNNTAIVFTVHDASKAYDGTALEPEEVTATGVPEGLLYYADLSGSQTDVGSSAATAAACYILDAEENDVTSYFTNITSVDGTLTVNKASVTITTEDLEKAYDGTALNGTASVTGLSDADKENVTVTATASIIDVGSTESTYTIDWGSVDQNNYTLTEEIGTLTVTKNDTEITFTSGSDEKTYDGTPLINNDVTVESLPSALSFTCTAGGTVSYVDAGTWKNKFNDIEVSGVDENGTEYDKWVYAVIKNSKGEDVTDNFTNIKFVEGTLTINPLPVTFDLACYDGVYDGWTYLPDGISGEYEDGSEVERESLDLLPTDSLNPTSITGTFNLTGGGQVKLTCEGKSDAGNYTITPTEEFLSGTAGNYDISYTNNKMSISPLALNVDLGSPVVDYDGKTHGGTITLTYGNGYNEGNTVTPTEATSNDTGSRTATYTLYTGPDFKVSAGCDGPEAGTYTLSCTTSFESANANNYSVTVTGDTLTINAITISEEVISEEPSGDAVSNTPSNTTVLSDDTKSSGDDNNNEETSDKNTTEDPANESSNDKSDQDTAGDSSGNKAKQDNTDDASASDSKKDTAQEAADTASGSNANQDNTDDASASDSKKDTAQEAADTASGSNANQDNTDDASASDSKKDTAQEAAGEDSDNNTKNKAGEDSAIESKKDADQEAAGEDSGNAADQEAAGDDSSKE